MAASNTSLAVHYDYIALCESGDKRLTITFGKTYLRSVTKLMPFRVTHSFHILQGHHTNSYQMHRTLVLSWGQHDVWSRVKALQRL